MHRFASGEECVADGRAALTAWAADPDASDHPVFRTKRIAADNETRRSHLRVVRHADDSRENN